MKTGLAAEDKDPAHVCVNMWENSKGHLDNILRNKDLSVVGIVFGSGGEFYCTQTFASPLGNAGVDFSERKCNTIAQNLTTALPPATAATTSAITTTIAATPAVQSIDAFFRCVQQCMDTASKDIFVRCMQPCLQLT
jgi:hypothetical protein